MTYDGDGSHEALAPNGTVLSFSKEELINSCKGGRMTVLRFAQKRPCNPIYQRFIRWSVYLHLLLNPMKINNSNQKAEIAAAIFQYAGAWKATSMFPS